MKKKNIKSNKKENYSKNPFIMTHNNSNELIYLGPENDYFSSFKSKISKTTLTSGRVKSKKLTNIHSKYEKKQIKTHLNKKYFPTVNNSLIYKNCCTDITNDYYFNNLNRYFSSSKNEVLNNIKKEKKFNQHLYYSLNKKESSQENDSIKLIKKNILKTSYLNKDNNFSKSSFKLSNNIIKLDFSLFKNSKEKQINCNLGKNYIYSKGKRNHLNNNLSLANKNSPKYCLKLKKKIENNLKNNIKTDVIYKCKYKEKKLNNNKYKLNISSKLKPPKKLAINIPNISLVELSNKNKENKNKEKDVEVDKNINNNNSSKPTIFSSYPASEEKLKSIIISDNEILNQNKDKKKAAKNLLIKDKSLLNLESELNEEETQEFESKFINYELGLSDRKSNLNYNLEFNNQNNQNNENIWNEYEKTAEEIQKKAELIINKSNFMNKKISYFKNNNKYIRLCKDLLINDDIEELKEGEEIQNVNKYFIQNNK